MNITEEDIIKIRKADWNTCVKWWDLLNSWEWPEDLPPEESPKIKFSPNSRRILLMNEIKNKVGEKYILRVLNTTQRGMTEEEFEDFWNGSRGDTMAFERWKNSLDFNKSL